MNSNECKNYHYIRRYLTIFCTLTICIPEFEKQIYVSSPLLNAGGKLGIPQWNGTREKLARVRMD